MRFFDREKEIERLNEIYELSKDHVQFTVVSIFKISVFCPQ